MKDKINDPTPQRPAGAHLLDAPVVQIDLRARGAQLKTEAPWSTSDRNAITLYKTDELRVALIALHEGAEMAEHSANGVLTVQVLEGEIDFRTEGKTNKLTEGQMVCLHRGLPHAVYATRESIFVLTLTGPPEV